MLRIIGKKFFEILTIISPKLSAIVLYVYRVKKIPHLKHPKKFSEKATNLKLSYKNNKLISKCADKYEVREFVESKGLGNILNELYFKFDNVEEIDFNKLPDKFVLKCTHGSGYNIICNNKNELNIEKTKTQLKKWLKEKYGLATQELHYLNIKPRIICEKNLCDEKGKIPNDYKIYCINGKAVGIVTCTNRKIEIHEVKCNFFDKEWNELPYIKEEHREKNSIPKPKGLDKMIEYAEKLSEDFKMVRVDFYNDNEKIIFGELTFTPACCCDSDYNEKGDIKLGELL